MSAFRDARRLTIGGSDIGKLVASLPDYDPLAVYISKTETEPETTEAWHEYGHHIESALASWAAKKLGYAQVVLHPQDHIVTRPDVPHCHATPDAYLCGPQIDGYDGEPTIHRPTAKHLTDVVAAAGGAAALVECKNWSAPTYTKRYRREGALALPLDVECQMHWAMGLTGTHKAVNVASLSGQAPVMFEVAFDPTLFRNLVKVAQAFIETYVLPGTPPAPTDWSSDSTRALVSRFEPPPEAAADPNASDMALAAELAKVRREMKALEARDKALVARLRTRLQVAGVRTFTGAVALSVAEKGAPNWKDVAHALAVELRRAPTDPKAAEPVMAGLASAMGLTNKPKTSLRVLVKPAGDATDTDDTTTGEGE